MTSEELVRRTYTLDVFEDPKTNKPVEEVILDDQGRLVERVSYNYHPEEMTELRERFDPETGKMHGQPAITEKCLISGVIFHEEYLDQGDWHREDGDAYITRFRATGQDETRVRWLHGVQYDVTPQGLFPTPE